MKMSGGIGNSSMGSACNCEGCQRIRKRDADIKEVEEKLQSQIVIIRESVAHSIRRLRREYNETLNHLRKDAEAKIEQIEKGEM